MKRTIFAILCLGLIVGAAHAADHGWPRTFNMQDGSTIVVYQPQVESWENQARMVLWSAVAYTPAGASQPAMGSIQFDSNTSISTEERLVSFRDLNILEVHFPTLSRDQLQALTAGIQVAMPDTERVISLDRVLGAVNKSEIAIKNRDDVKADPPLVVWSQTPAILVILDGGPVWSPIEGADLKYAVNTNWDLFQTGGRLYLRDDQSWYAADSLGAPWSPAGRLPDAFSHLPPDSNWADARASLPGTAAPQKPRIFVSESPAEMILLDGAPQYEAITNTHLMWVSNTESDLFRMGSSGAFYYLVAGRWFSAASLDGPWTFATPNLPDEFKLIPVDHPRSRVLASVPGTDQAIEAALLAEVPQTARVDVKTCPAPSVAYQGDPQFESIPGTTCSRAVNTDKDVIQVGDTYYVCYLGVWFAGQSPSGPWAVTTSVPDAIYSIPASSPAHEVVYVTEAPAAPSDEYVTFAYVPAYTGICVAWGCAVWGTGWYYPPYVAWGPHPIYYPYACTYGCGAWYNPYTGAYGRASHVYGPYGGAGYAASYNARTGTYKRGAAVYGPYNSKAAGQAWNPRTGTYAQTRQSSNVYGNWGSSSVQRGDQWAASGHVTNYATGRTTSGAATSKGGAAIHTGGPSGSSGIARTGSGDIYAGHDGSVYRNNNGEWQKWNGNGWSQGHNPNAPGGLSSTPRTPGTGAATNAGAGAGHGAGGGMSSSASHGAAGTGGGMSTNVGGGSGAGTAAGAHPSARPSPAPAAPSPNLERDYQQRNSGNQRADANSAWRSSGQPRQGAGSFGTGAGRAGGGGAGRGGR